MSYAVSVVALIALSISRISRWDLLDHFAMADRFKYFGSFYPIDGDDVISGVSFGYRAESLELSDLLRRGRQA